MLIFLLIESLQIYPKKNHFLFLKLFYSSDIFKHFLCLRYKGGVAGRRQIKKYKIDFYLLQLTI